jgi:predicted patatin/cPLA2 family phospholipase
VRDTSVGIVDVLEGDYRNFNSDDLQDNSQLLDVLFASFAFPGFFAPAEVFDSKYFDGSAVYDIDIFSGINKCIEKGHQEQDIVVDVIFTSSANLKSIDAEDYKSISMLFRYLEISSFYSSMDGLLRAKFSYPQANFRYAISPTKSLPSSHYPLVSIVSLY